MHPAAVRSHFFGALLSFYVSNVGVSYCIFDTAFLFSEGMEAVDALKVFMPGPPGVVRQIISNPGDLPDLVAIRRDTDNEIRDQGPAVEIIDTRQLTVVAGWKGGLTEETTPTISTNISALLIY